MYLILIFNGYNEAVCLLANIVKSLSFVCASVSLTKRQRLTLAAVFIAAAFLWNLDG